MDSAHDILGRGRVARGLRAGDEEMVRILLVEDSPIHAVLLRAVLGRADRGHFQVVHAPRLETALECLAEQSYDAVLLDLGLPEQERAQAIDAAGAVAQRLPVVVLTGTEDRQLASRAEGAPAGEAVLSRVVRAGIAQTILRAIRCNRRFGVGANAPVFCRIPGT